MRFIPSIKNRIASGAGILAAAALLVSCGGSKTEKIIVAGSGWDSVAIIDKASKAIEWAYALPRGEGRRGAPECNSAEVLPDGNVLISYKRGARLVDRKNSDRVIWDYTDLADTAELQTAKQLPDGGFLLGICDGPARIVELDVQGKVRKEVKYDLGLPIPHTQFRRIAKAANGNYLIPVIGEGVLVEIDGSGDFVREYHLDGGPFDVQELPDGDLLIALGGSTKAVVMQRSTGYLLREIGGENPVKGAKLYFVAQTAQLENGNTMLANWQGYLPEGDSGDAQLLEVDSEGNLVWSFDGRGNGVKNLSAFYPFAE